MAQSFPGVSDKLAGALIGCIAAADVAHPDGEDREFAEWLVGALEAFAHRGRGGYGSASVKEPIPLSRQWHDSTIVASAVAAVVLGRHHLNGTGSLAWDEPSEVGPQSARNRQGVGATWLASPKAWQDMMLRATLQYLGDADISQVFAVQRAELPSHEYSAEPLLDATDAGERYTFAEYVLAAEAAGANLIPESWWAEGCLADVGLRAKILRALAATDVVQVSHEFVDAIAAGDSATMPIEHPAMAGVYFGSRSQITAIPTTVSALVSVAPVPALLLPRHVKIVWEVPWLFDCAYSSAVYINADFDEFEEGVTTQLLVIPVGDEHLRVNFLEPQASAAINQVAAMVDELVSGGHSVFVLGDKDPTTLTGVWRALEARSRGAVFSLPRTPPGTRWRLNGCIATPYHSDSADPLPAEDVAEVQALYYGDDAQVGSAACRAHCEWSRQKRRRSSLASVWVAPSAAHKLIGHTPTGRLP